MFLFLEARILFWYHSDYLGNVDLITERDGYAYEYFQYNPWGEEMHHWNSNAFAFSSPYRFNAKELDNETGLHYYGARFYQNKLGLWLSVDPLAHETREPFLFSRNNPIMLVDPDGRKVKWNLSAFIAAAKMIGTKTGRENLRDMMSDKDVTHVFKISTNIGLSIDNNGNYGVIAGVSYAKEGDPCTMVSKIYLGSYRLKRFAEKRYGENWGSLGADKQHSALRIFRNRGKTYERIEDSGSNTGRVYSLRNVVTNMPDNYQTADQHGYINYSPMNQRLFEFIAQIGIHESTHSLVESGNSKWVEMNMRILDNGGDSETLPQLREKQWYDEHKSKRYNR